MNMQAKTCVFVLRLPRMSPLPFPAPQEVDLTCVGVPDTTLQLTWDEPAVSGCEGQGESLVVLGYVVEVLNLETGNQEEDTRLSDTDLQFPVTDRGMNSSSWLDVQSRVHNTDREGAGVYFLPVCISMYLIVYI